MTKLVSAASITGLTAAADFHGMHGVPPAPSREALLAELRKTDPSALDKIVKDIPAGFDLAPVFYSRIGKDENARIMAEYTFFVRTRFLTFLAKDHADDLRALGICENGIERMSRGLDPADIDGNMYDISIDHIIERSGSGNWGVTQTIDPDQPNNPYPNFLPNHFNNLILLPDHIHQLKNQLNDLQGFTDCKLGQGKWGLMLVPIVDANNKGYVCAAQPKNSKWHGIRFRPNNIATQLNQTAYSISLAKDALDHFAKVPEIAAILKMSKDIADARGQKPVDIANDNNAINGQSLRKAFENACANNQDADYWNKRARNAVAEVCTTLEKAHNHSKSQLNHRDDRAFRQFDDFFNSYAVKKLSNAIVYFPCEAAVETNAFLKSVSQALSKTRNQLDAKPRLHNNKSRRR